MTKGFLRFLRRNTIALLALFLALGGTTYAASTALGPRNSVASPQVVNGSLQTKDLSAKARKALKGNRGLRGLTGAQGAKGATGAQGVQGVQGVAGTSATKLFASVGADCGSLDRGSGAISIDLNFAARCDVRFNQSVASCLPVVSFKGTAGASWQLTVNTTTDAPSLTQLDANEIGVTYRDNAGALITTNRPAFQLAVFC
jgi:hypothetical protein